MTNLRYGNEAENAVNHAETCAENRNNSKLFAADLVCGHLGHGSFDLDFFNGKISGEFVAHEHCDLGEKFAEVLGTGILISHNAELMLDERVVHFMKSILDHDIFFLSVI